MTFIDRVRECNAHDLSRFRPLKIGETQIGWVRHALVGRLADFPKVFEIGKESVRIAAALEDYEARTEAVAGVVETLAEKGDIPALRDEVYPAAPDFGAAPLFAIDRAAVPAFGIRARGVHLNGFLRRDDGVHMWVGRRGEHRQNYPGMLDQMVAGGQPIDLGLLENLRKEALEEASVPDELIAKAVPVGAITYCCEGEGGLKQDIQYCFDLELPEEFEPANVDGEISEFHLWPIGKVAEVVAGSKSFKFNCNLVIIDFLIRHGLLSPDDEPDYAALARGLRQ